MTLEKWFTYVEMSIMKKGRHIRRHFFSHRLVKNLVWNSDFFNPGIMIANSVSFKDKTKESKSQLTIQGSQGKYIKVIFKYE